MKKFSLLESFKYSDEEIEDFFMQFVDDRRFSISSGFINANNRFFTDVSSIDEKTKRCKMVNIEIPNILNGIQGPNGERSMTSLESLQNILSEIKKFYNRSGEPPNFVIKQIYVNVEIIFFLVGGLVEKSDTKIQDKIIDLQKELLEISKKRGYKVKLKNNNWIDITTSSLAIYNGIVNIFKQLIDGNLQENERNQPLIEWYQKVTNAGLRFSRSGVDNQIIIQLKK